MNDKVSITYSEKNGLVVKVGWKVIPNSIIADPLDIRLSGDGHKVKLDMYLDHLAVSDIEALAKYVRLR